MGKDRIDIQGGVMQRRKAAFSLVELSIVLVIFGLLAGGVLAGRALIRASEIRAITVERNKYSAAVFSFRDKYFALPGDMANAYNYFGGAACGTNTTNAAAGCNGNGDGLVMFLYGENTKAWEHLARAGLIEGNYDGNGIDTGNGVEPRPNNTPPSKFPLGAWDLSHEPMNMANMVGTDNGQLYLHFGSLPGPGNTNLMALPTLTLGEAFRLDTKIDDGHANTGDMRGDDSATYCFDSGTDYYGIGAGGSSTVDECVLHFIVM
jgi:prepilin-type N-terminal cleavage/methylation domain-containing protein